jgi:hypothetical protein
MQMLSKAAGMQAPTFFIHLSRTSQPGLNGYGLTGRTMTMDGNHQPQKFNYL